MVGVSWLPHQPSQDFHDMSSPTFVRALAIVIPSHMLNTVKFALPKSLIIWHACQELLNTIPVFEASET
jgi:hypothetical protein